MATKDTISAGTGRRKTATARVNLVKGSGKWTVNTVALEEYIPSEALRDYLKQPVAISGYDMEKVDVVVFAKGGGISGQAGAIRHGLARALVAADETSPLDFTFQDVWLQVSDHTIVIIWVVKIFFVQFFCVFLPPLLNIFCFC